MEARARADVQANGGSWTNDWAPWVVGGGFRWGVLGDELPGGFAPNDTAVAYEATDGLALVLTGGDATPLPVEEALADPLPTAVWVLDLVYGVDAAFLRGE